MRYYKLFELVAVVSILVAACFFYWKESRHVSRMKVADGYVMDVGGKRENVRGNQFTADVTAKVVYSVAGKNYRISSRFFGIPRWKVGEPVSVLFFPERSEIARINRIDDIYSLTLLFGTWFSLFLMWYVGVCILFLVRRNLAAKVV